MPDLDLLRVLLGAVVGLAVLYFVVPDGAPEPVAARPPRRDLMAEHLGGGHRRHEADCPLCDHDLHGPVG